MMVEWEWTTSYATQFNRSGADYTRCLTALAAVAIPQVTNGDFGALVASTDEAPINGCDRIGNGC